MTELEQRLSAELRVQQQIFERKLKEITDDYQSSLKQISEAYAQQLQECEQARANELTEHEARLNKLQEIIMKIVSNSEKDRERCLREKEQHIAQLQSLQSVLESKTRKKKSSNESDDQLLQQLIELQVRFDELLQRVEQIEQERIQDH